MVPLLTCLLHFNDYIYKPRSFSIFFIEVSLSTGQWSMKRYINWLNCWELGRLSTLATSLWRLRKYLGRGEQKGCNNRNMEKSAVRCFFFFLQTKEWNLQLRNSICGYLPGICGYLPKTNIKSSQPKFYCGWDRWFLDLIVYQGIIKGR